MSAYSPVPVSSTTQINGNPMYFERRGIGSHFLLLIPGALATGNLHFSQQHSGFDLTKFTLISPDLVGIGRSRPAKRSWVRHYWFDAECCHSLMKELGVSEYSIFGFSDGGRVGLVMASLYPEEVKRVVVVGSSSYITEDEKKTLLSISHVKDWASAARAEFEGIYEEEDLQELWTAFLKAYLSYTDIFKSELSKIKCPVFVLHGEFDRLVSVEHAHFFSSNLKDVRLYVEPKGRHDFHTKSYAAFNKMAMEFLLGK